MCAKQRRRHAPVISRVLGVLDTKLHVHINQPTIGVRPCRLVRLCGWMQLPPLLAIEAIRCLLFFIDSKVTLQNRLRELQ